MPQITPPNLILVTIPCLTDNYAYLIHDPKTGDTALIDAPAAAPILNALSERGWKLGQIFLTHHHWDHVDGAAEIVAATGAAVLGAAADAHRLPPLARSLSEGDFVQVGGSDAVVMDVSGHTVGHIAFYFATEGLAFTADSLMAGGCGRLFEGTPDMMFASLQKIAALLPQTWICSGHEYTTSNLAFAAHVDGDNPALIARIAKVAAVRSEGRATVPSRLSGELATNPFLRTAALQQGLGAETEAQAFGILRAMKNDFKG